MTIFWSFHFGHFGHFCQFGFFQNRNLNFHSKNEWNKFVVEKIAKFGWKFMIRFFWIFSFPNCSNKRVHIRRRTGNHKLRCTTLCLGCDSTWSIWHTDMAHFYWKIAGIFKGNLRVSFFFYHWIDFWNETENYYMKCIKNFWKESARTCTFHVPCSFESTLWTPSEHLSNTLRIP